MGYSQQYGMTAKINRKMPTIIISEKQRVRRSQNLPQHRNDQKLRALGYKVKRGSVGKASFKSAGKMRFSGGVINSSLQNKPKNQLGGRYPQS